MLSKQELKAMEAAPATLEEQIKEVAYELAMRENAYPRFVVNGNLKEAEAIRHYQVLKAVLQTLRQLQLQQMAEGDRG